MDTMDWHMNATQGVRKFAKSYQFTLLKRDVYGFDTFNLQISIIILTEDIEISDSPNTSLTRVKTLS